MDYIYDISCFYWNKESRTFYADAWNLITQLPDGSIHLEAFPNDKRQFFIRNDRTGGFRRFTLINDTATHYTFESEDGIRCEICINVDYLEHSSLNYVI